MFDQLHPYLERNLDSTGAIAYFAILILLLAALVILCIFLLRHWRVNRRLHKVIRETSGILHGSDEYAAMKHAGSQLFSLTADRLGPERYICPDEAWLKALADSIPECTQETLRPLLDGMLRAPSTYRPLQSDEKLKFEKTIEQLIRKWYV